MVQMYLGPTALCRIGFVGMVFDLLKYRPNTSKTTCKGRGGGRGEGRGGEGEGVGWG